MAEQELVKMVSDYVSAINSFGINYFVCGLFLGFGFFATVNAIIEVSVFLAHKNREYREKRKSDKKNKEKTDEK
ncbi:hypothetical protein [uncultured Eubacterium sp.]|uniref:hypothetical protein n=1 Tax=uncultured Eubacterium sp. TaxID=165185 RepID=UPI0028037FEC|nr:hypothetical protein [uncultured Eubacterium sp.]